MFNYSPPSGKFPTQNISMSIPTFWLKSQAWGVELARKMNLRQQRSVSRGHQPGPTAGQRLIPTGTLRFLSGSCRAHEGRPWPRLSTSAHAQTEQTRANKRVFTVRHSSGIEDVWSLLSRFLHTPTPLRGEGLGDRSQQWPLWCHLIPALPSALAGNWGQAGSSALRILALNCLFPALTGHAL